MSLLSFFQELTTVGPHRVLTKNHAIGNRLVHLEHEKGIPEVKTYPLSGIEPLFALCWNMDGYRHLTATLLPSPAPFCCRIAFQKDAKTQLHTHDYIELAYVVKGEFHQRILGRDVTFQTGDLCLIDKNCVHQDYLLDTPAFVVFLGLSNQLFDEVLRESVTNQKILLFLQSALLEQKRLQQYLHFRPSPAAKTALAQCMLALLTELDDVQAGAPMICKGYLMRIFQLLSTGCEIFPSKEFRQAMSWVTFEEISDYIRHHSDTVTIRELTDVFYFQEDYFNRLIKDKTGMTYCEYLQSIRLDQAAHLLLSTDDSIDEIVKAVGYQNKGFFYQIFRRRFGMTPGKFRKMHGALTPQPPPPASR